MIKIRIAKDIGIIKAARLPVIWPGDNEDPIIKITPVIARNIEMPRLDINQLDLQENEAVLEEIYTTKNISEKSIAQIIDK